MSAAIHLLIVEDSDADALLIATQLRRNGIALTYDRVQTAAALTAALAARLPDAVISDYNMPSFSAHDALQIIHEHHLDLPFILVSGQIGEETAAAMMRAGAHDFVLKDRMSRLVPAVQRELREAEQRRQRREAEASLRDSEERFRLLAEHARDIIFRYRLEPDARLDYISPAVTALTGYRPDELYANSALIAAMVDPADREAFEASWRSPNPPTLVVRWCRRDGTHAWMQQRAVGIRDSDGSLVAVEGILRDISDQVVADQQRERLDRELRQAERLDSLGRLAGGIAHDFNNLLAVITAYAADVIAALPAEHPCRHDLSKISQAADRAAALTRQLLLFSRLDPSQPETLDLNRVVTDIEQMLRRIIGEDIEFVTTLQPDLPPVTIDRGKIEQVVVNLVMNSRAAMPNGGRLCLTSHEAAPSDTGYGGDDQHRRQVHLTVSDTGMGMTPDVARRAFEPFFTTKGPGEGTGLGLATTYGVVTEAGGDIRLSTEPGHGTSITVILPAADRPLTEPAAAGPPPSPGSGQAIVVVEDEDAVREVVVRILTRSGYHVLPAATPKDAVELCANAALDIDALLTDVIMPEMSGPQLAARVHEVRPHLPVLLMSGYTAGSPLSHEPATDLPLVRKPFTAGALLQHLHDLLAVRPATEHPRRPNAP
jgi:PAS domain S-box-containing protein